MCTQNKNNQEKGQWKPEKLSQPENITGFFGKKENVKFWQFSTKNKLFNENMMLKLKGHQMQLNDSFFLNWQPSFELKVHDVKMSLFLQPFSKKINQYDILLNTSFDCFKVQGKTNATGDGHIKLVQEADLIKDAFNYKFQIFSKMNKFKLNHQYTAEFLLKKNFYFIFLQNWKSVHEERLKLKLATGKNSQAKFQTCHSLTKYENSKFQKNKFLYKLYSEHRLTYKFTKNYQYRWLFTAMQNKYKNIIRSQLNFENRDLKKWDLKYMNKYFSTGYIGFMVGSKGWQGIIEKQFFHVRAGVSVSNKVQCIKFESNSFKKCKFQIDIFKKQNQYKFGATFQGNY